MDMVELSEVHGRPWDDVDVNEIAPIIVVSNVPNYLVTSSINLSTLVVSRSL